MTVSFHSFTNACPTPASGGTPCTRGGFPGSHSLLVECVCMGCKTMHTASRRSLGNPFYTSLESDIRVGRMATTEKPPDEEGGGREDEEGGSGPS